MRYCTNCRFKYRLSPEPCASCRNADAWQQEESVISQTVITIGVIFLAIGAAFLLSGLH